MLEVVSWFITGFITYVVSCKIFCNLNDIKFKFSKKFLITIILFCCFDCYVHDLYLDGIRVLFINLGLILILKKLYNISFAKTVLSEILILLMSLISEVISYLIISIFPFDSDFLKYNFIGIMAINIITIFLTLFFSRILNKKLKNIIKWYKENKYVNMLLLPIIIILVEFILWYPIYNGKVVGYHANIYVAMILFVTIFVYGYFKQRSKNNEIIYKYENLLDYSKTYEKVITEKSKNQHEYKNQLLLIRGMIESKDKKIIQYIDKLLNQNDSDTKHEWLSNLTKIPSGGLRGLICYNLDNAVERGLISYVSVSDDISNDEIWQICDDNLQAISIIIGVYLTNAVEAALESDKKYVTIDVDYINYNIVFTISNTYKKLPNLSKINKDSYTTKGKGHGYGLSLVRDIVTKNNIFEIKTELNGMYYVQKLIIKK